MKTSSPARLPGQKMTAAERSDLIALLVDKMLEGLYSDNKLAELCNVDRDTIKRYKPAAAKIINTTRIDRTNIRAMQIQRVYNRLEKLNLELEEGGLTIKEKMAIHNQITKLEQHLALITGLNLETKINVNRKQLVIVRAHPTEVNKARKQAIEGEVVE